ncbi:MAG: IS200/IS605 family transposase [Spirochaetota bacterium]
MRLTSYHTYYRLDYHLVFVVKHREPLFSTSKLLSFQKLTQEKAKELQFTLHLTNGYKDHVHLLLSTKPSAKLSNIVKHIKGYFSFCHPNFKWQRGYSAFTVDITSFDRIYQYVKNQKKHHKNESLEDEISFLTEVLC